LKFEFRVWEHLVSLGLVVFARFFKNQKNQKKPKKKQQKTKTKTKKKPNKAGWFIGDAVACFFLRLTYRRDRPCRDPLKRDSGRYAITLMQGLPRTTEIPGRETPNS